MAATRTKSIRRGQLVLSAQATASFSAPLFRIFDAVAVFEDDQRSPPGADSHLGLRVDLERAGDEPVGRVAVPRPANPQLVLRNHGDRDGQTVRPDDDHADRGAELDTPAAETVALHRNLTEHLPCLPATGSTPGVQTGANAASMPAGWFQVPAGSNSWCSGIDGFRSLLFGDPATGETPAQAVLPNERLQRCIADRPGARRACRLG